MCDTKWLLELQEKLRVGLHSTEVTDGSILLNPRLSSDPLWCSRTLQKQETSSSVKVWSRSCKHIARYIYNLMNGTHCMTL